MENSESDQAKPTIDQKGQTISGDQTNVAGDYYAAPAQPVQRSHPLFLFATIAVLSLVAIVAIFVNSQRTGIASLPTISTPTMKVIDTPLSKLASATESPTLTPESTQEVHCLEQYSAERGQENVITLEEGVRDTDVQLNQNDYLVIQFTEEKKPIGLIYLLLLTDSKSFKVETLLDEQCHEITDIDPTTLKNWEALEFSINVQTYSIRLGYQGDHIRIIGLRRYQ